VPYLSNKLYQAHLYHEANRRKRKEKYDSEKRLTFAQSAALRIEIAELSSHYEKLIEKNKFERMDDQELIKKQQEKIDHFTNLIAEEEVRKNRFKVLSAHYGLGSNTIDVTNQLQALLEGESLAIDNATMGSDPVPNKRKDLYILYQKGGKMNWFYTQEYYQLTIQNGDLIVEDTVDSIRLRDFEVFQELLKYFQGEWKLEYTGTINGSEDLILQLPNQYCIKQANCSFKPVFELSDLRINENEGTINYTKNGIGRDKRKTTGKLQIKVQGSLYEGFENDGNTKVIYRKINPENPSASEKSPAVSET
jgi:hypothetical protein